MLKFEKPDYKVNEYIEDNHYGKFVIEPLERGFGTTMGNALRRVMLSSLPGDAISSVKIDGVLHEFQKIDGVIEDVTAIVLNLKGIVIKNHSDDYSYKLTINKNTEGEVYASDIECDPDIEILNPDKVICTLVEGGSINMEMTIANGRGYNRAEENKVLYGENAKENTIFIDSLFSPIERINYEVEDARVGQDNSFDKSLFSMANSVGNSILNTVSLYPTTILFPIVCSDTTKQSCSLFISKFCSGLSGLLCAHPTRKSTDTENIIIAIYFFIIAVPFMGLFPLY